MDDRIDDIIEEGTRDYNEPPATPRDLMWERIRAARAETRAPARRFGYLRYVAAIAALLVAGIAIGRSIGRPAPTIPAVAAAPHDTAPRSAPTITPEESTVALVPRDTGTTPAIAAGHAPAGRASVAYNVALSRHLGQSETFLTLFRGAARAGRVEPVAFAAARHLLSTNRLLLDSRAGADPRTRRLLEDLELVLAGIGQLRSAGDTVDAHIINEGIDRGDMLPRLRTAVPAGI